MLGFMILLSIHIIHLIDMLSRNKPHLPALRQVKTMQVTNKVPTVLSSISEIIIPTLRPRPASHLIKIRYTTTARTPRHSHSNRARIQISYIY